MQPTVPDRLFAEMSVPLLALDVYKILNKVMDNIPNHNDLSLDTISLVTATREHQKFIQRISHFGKTVKQRLRKEASSSIQSSSSNRVPPPAPTTVSSAGEATSSYSGRCHHEGIAADSEVDASSQPNGMPTFEKKKNSSETINTIAGKFGDNGDLTLFGDALDKLGAAAHSP